MLIAAKCRLAIWLLACSISVMASPISRDVYVDRYRDLKKVAIKIVTWPNGHTRYDERYYLTEDLGKTWKQVEESNAYDNPLQISPNGIDQSTLYRLQMDPSRDSRTIIEKSLDKGNSWQRASANIKGTSESLTFYQFLTFDPIDPSTLYVCGNVLGQDKPDSPEVLGVYVSKDKGETFTFLFAGLSSFNFAISRSRPATMYAVVHGNCLIKSDDSGKIWVSIGLPDPMRDSIYTLIADPRDHQKIYAHTTNAIWITSDAGRNWKQLNPIRAGVIESMALALQGNEIAIFAAVKGRLFVSRNEGESWSEFDLESYPKIRINKPK